MQNSMEIFNFLFLDWIYSCWVNFAKKFKIGSLSWNLIPGLFWICKSWWWCSLVLFLFFFWKFDQNGDTCYVLRVTWLFSRQFTRGDVKLVAFLVRNKKWKISNKQLSFDFPWLSALVCNNNALVQTVLCY